MGPRIAGSHCWLMRGDRWCFLVCVFCSKNQVSTLAFNFFEGTPAFTTTPKGSLRKDAVGNRIWKLSLGFLSECVGVGLSVHRAAFL